ncbi:MAG TPA: hypothetical protein VMT95_11695 [Candidatus Binatia bacterium]|nr:hypothetical protein [Candidatus Binatia bacterium]
MSFAQILNIAIVICGVYAGLSCLCSWVNERIAAFLALRGWNLFRGIANLLGTDQLAATVFNHPLVAANSPKPNQFVDATGKSTLQRFLNVAASRPPSYLDARNFSSALWQVLPGVAQSATAPVSDDPGTSGAETEAIAQTLVAAPLSAVATLEAAVGRLGAQHEKLQQQLQSLLAQAGDDYTKLLAATDAWFNAEMDRVTGWYARQTQWIIIVIAFFIVSFAGVDTLEMVRTLSIANPADLSVVANSILVQNCTKSTPTSLQAQCPPSTSPPATTSLTNGPTKDQPFDITQFAHVRADFANWAWSSKTQSGLEYGRWQGMLLTWLALALGGPFWFNLLCSIANIRSAGTKPDGGSQPTKA